MRNQFQRPCDVFLDSPGCLLGDHGFMADPGRVQYGHNTNSVKLYHYTHHSSADSLGMTPATPARRRWEFHGWLRLERLLKPCQPIHGMGEAASEPVVSIGGKGWI